MPRVSDVDTIAPDDQVTSSPVPIPTKKSITLQKDSKVTKTSAITSVPPVKVNANPLIESIYKILGHTKHPLSSLLINPHVFDFQERDDDEVVLLVARQHWFTNVRWILITLFMVLFPLLFRFVPTLLEIPGTYLFVGYLFCYLFLFL